MRGTGGLDWRWWCARNEKSGNERTGGAELTFTYRGGSWGKPDALLHEGDRDGREAAVGAGLLSKVAGGCLDRGVPPLRGAFPVGGALVGVTPALAHGSTPRTLSICELTDPETHGRSQNVLCLTRK